MKYFFKVNEDLVSRSLARKLGLRESSPGIWFLTGSSTAQSRQNLQSAFNHFDTIKINETTSGSVSAVMNTGSKPASQVGTLFGGTFKQKKSQTEENTQTFAGEIVGQKTGDQVRGNEKARKSSKQHPFKGRLVGSN